MKPHLTAWSRYRALPAMLFCGLALTGGCPRSPEITSWTVRPGLVCPGEPVQVGWQTRNATAVTVTASPRTTPSLPSPTPSSGGVSVQIGGATSFAITARDATRDAPAAPPLRADLLLGSGSAALVFPWNGCFGSGAGTYGRPDLAGQYSGRIRVGSVRNLNSDRSVGVSLGGASVALAPGEASVALSGQRLDGLWSVTPQLLSDRDGISPRQEGCQRDDVLTPGILIYVDPPPVSLQVEYSCA